MNLVHSYAVDFAILKTTLPAGRTQDSTFGC